MDPAQLQLWTRERADDAWEPLPTVYDEQQQAFTVWLTHFSQFTLAQALSSAAVLPSVRASTADRTTGGHAPIPHRHAQGIGWFGPQPEFALFERGHG